MPANRSSSIMMKMESLKISEDRLDLYESPDSIFQKYMAGWMDFKNSLDSGNSVRMNLLLQSANQYMMTESNLFSANS